MNTTRSDASPRGFALAELLLVLLLLALLAFLLTGALLGLQRAMLPQAVVCDSEVLTESPCFAPVPDALELHRVFLSRLRGSSAVYVFGGRSLEPSEAQGSRPLARFELPVFSGFGRGLPLNAEEFQGSYADQLGEAEVSPGEADFSVLVLGPSGGSLAATCLVQCRSRLFTMPEQPGSWMRRETVLLDAELGRLRYVFAEPFGDQQPSFVGALHCWYRRQPQAGFGEEGPAHVVFPDPWLFKGTDASGRTLSAESHYSYLLAIGR